MSLDEIVSRMDVFAAGAVVGIVVLLAGIVGFDFAHDLRRMLSRWGFPTFDEQRERRDPRP